MLQENNVENFAILFFNFIFEEILHEIAFTEEMRTTWSNKKVPQTFFHNSPYLRNYFQHMLKRLRYYTHFTVSLNGL